MPQIIPLLTFTLVHMWYEESTPGSALRSMVLKLSLQRHALICWLNDIILIYLKGCKIIIISNW